MTRSYRHTFTVLAFAAATLAVMPVSAQDGGRQPSIFDRLFGGGDREARQDEGQRPPQNPQSQNSQNSAADLAVRIERLESQIRQLNGVIEQLQYRNQQLETQLQRQQGAGGQQAQVPMQSQTQTPGSTVMRPPVPGPTQIAPTASNQLPPIVSNQAPTAATGRRGDAFDPTQNPNAPGVGGTLGQLSSAPPSQQSQYPNQNPNMSDSAVGAPGGRQPGAPLDLTTMGNNQSNEPASNESSVLPPPPSRNPSSTGNPSSAGVMASTLPPSATPRDQFDLGYGYIQRKDYALAEDALQTFLTKYPSDRMAPEAQFWLGESRFQRQRYDAAAESFLAVSTKHTSNAKAPDAMLRLGQSLAALGQKEMACAKLAEVGRKFPRASANVRQGVEREQKRAHC